MARRSNCGADRGCDGGRMGAVDRVVPACGDGSERDASTCGPLSCGRSDAVAPPLASPSKERKEFDPASTVGAIWSTERAIRVKNRSGRGPVEQAPAVESRLWSRRRRLGAVQPHRPTQPRIVAKVADSQFRSIAQCALDAAHDAGPATGGGGHAPRHCCPLVRPAQVWSYGDRHGVCPFGQACPLSRYFLYPD